MNSNPSEPAVPGIPEAKVQQQPANQSAQRGAGPPTDPWQEFLGARTRVVEWLVREYGWSDAQIARQLSLSPGQVQRMRPPGENHARSGASDTDVTMAAPLDN